MATHSLRCPVYMLSGLICLWEFIMHFKISNWAVRRGKAGNHEVDTSADNVQALLASLPWQLLFWFSFTPLQPVC